MRKFFTVAALVFFSASSWLTAQLNINSSFEPAVVSAGEPALFRIDLAVEGRSPSIHNLPPPTPPSVEGLRFQYIGPSHETRIINGQVSFRVSHLFRASTSEPGQYTVPKFAFAPGSLDAEIPAATLEVVEGPAGQGQAGTGSQRPAWLEVSLPRENLYVGETTPVGVRLFLNRQQVINASLQAEHPEKIGDAFSIGEFGRMTQQQVPVDGIPMTVADWNVLLTPLKTGSQPLIFEVPLTVSLRNSRRGNDPFDSFFGPSPFDRLFGRETVRAYSEDREVEILPLPQAGRPDDFTGGIGNFRIEETRISSFEVQVGEPLLFSVTLSGQGNFDRLEPPVMKEEPDRWREYDPETSFTPRDSLGYSGAKTFTYTLAPQSEDISTSPAFSFSYFDPETAEYRTVEIPPTTLTVNPAPPGSRPPVPEPGESNPVEARRGPDLLPIQKVWDDGDSRTLRPFLFSGGFIALQSVLLVLLIAAYLILRHRALLRDDPDYARRNRARRASRRFLIDAQAHAGAGEVGPFFRAACRAIQESVGPFQNGEPESLTESDVLKVLRERGQPEAILNRVHRFFAAEEMIQYSGRKAASVNLNEENQQLRDLAKTLNGRRRKSPSIGQTLPLLLALITLSLLPTPDLGAQEASAPAATEENANPIPAVNDEAEAETAFAAGVDAYEFEDFNSAAESFRSILPAYSSSKVHYNLANSLYRLRQYPEAILHYEKAFVLDPTNPDIVANLSLAREAASLDAPAPPLFSFIGYRLSWGAWTLILTMGFWGLVATLLLARPTRLLPLWRNLLIAVFSLLLIAAVLSQITWFSTANRAIVLTANAPLRLAPTASSPVETRMTAGIPVTTGDVYGDFQRVRLENGDEGWVLRSSIESVWE